MDFANEYQLNDSAIKEGVWKTLPSGLRVKVASIRNPRYEAEIIRLKRLYSTEHNLTDPETIKKITCQAMAKEILIDWKGAEDSKTGKEVPYSRETAEQMLNKYTIFREQVSVVAANDNNYKPEIIAGK